MGLGGKDSFFELCPPVDCFEFQAQDVLLFQTLGNGDSTKDKMPRLRRLLHH